PSLIAQALRSIPRPDGPRGYVWVAGESRTLRGVRRHLRRELGLPASAYKVVGYWIERAEEWNARYRALDDGTRRGLDQLWRQDPPEDEIEAEYDRQLTSLGL
ncbi:MAG: SIP domain-containing protein, partial [Nocardioidaceae bacterium]